MSAPRSSLGLGSLIVALVIILALGVGTVYAAIPNGNGTYYACLTKSSGVVRLINYPKQKCAKGERFIKWNQQGPQGAQGPQGPQGPQGAQGPKGDPGPQGPVAWSQLTDIPARVLAGDTTRSFIASTSDEYATGTVITLEVWYPANLDLEVTAIPAKDGAFFNTHPLAGYGDEIFSRDAGWIHHYLYFRLYTGGPSAVKARVTVWNDSYIAPAAAKRMVNATFHNGLKVPKGLKRPK